MAEIQKVGNVFYSVGDMEAAVAFYRDVLGLTLKFRDGGQWTAFDVNGVTLALSGEAEGISGGGAVVSLKVDDLDQFVEMARQRGAAVGPIQTGPHERRALVTDPSGNKLVLYGPNKPGVGA